LLLPSATDATTSLKSFSDSASHLGLNISWPKTKLQNTGSGCKPPDISVDSNTVESVNSFVYLGSFQSSYGQCRPDLTRRIGLACAMMTSLKRIWSDKRLTLDTKLCIYQTLVLSLLLYTGLAEGNGRLLLGIWRDSLHITCGLTACTPGSAPGPTLGNDYGKTLPFTVHSRHLDLTIS